MTEEPVLHVRVPRGRPVRGVALVLHGGQSDSMRRTRAWQPAVLRLVPFARSLHRAGAADGLVVARLRYRVRGWNGTAQSSVSDARWALDVLSKRFPGVPVGLVGHSLGGRTALRVADQEAVASVAALAPWLPSGEPVVALAGRQVLIVHGTGDRTTSPDESAAWAARARRVADQVSYVSVRGERHAMLRRPRLWHGLATGFTIGALWHSAVPGTEDLIVTNTVRDALAGEPSLVV